MQSRFFDERLVLAGGVLALVGCFGAMAANLIGTIVVESHDPISETISKLAIGPYAWLQDVGLDMLALGLIALAAGLFLWKMDGWRWRAGLLLLVLLGIDVFLIAEHNQYADRPGRGAAIHIYLVYVLYALFFFITFLLAPGLRGFGNRWRYFSLGLSIAWLVLAPYFFFISTRWDGAYERFLALLMLTWVGSIAWLLVRQRRRP